MSSFNKQIFLQLLEEMNKAGSTLVAVTKTTDTTTTQQAIDEGVLHIGENRLQAAKEKFPHLNGNFSKHFIGRLQTNKVKEVVSMFDYIHSVDSLKLATRIDEECYKQQKKVKVFYQINVSGEESKAGFSHCEFDKNWTVLGSLKNFDLIGLMTMAPFCENPEETRKYFRLLRHLAIRYGLRDLSMGMSNDYKTAMEEGATFLRIGSLLFS